MDIPLFIFPLSEYSVFAEKNDGLNNNIRSHFDGHMSG